MDRKTIERYGTDIYSYRLRTARQKKRMQREDFEKWLRKQRRLSDEIRDLQHAMGWKQLEPPVQKGWKRSFVLREDIAHSVQAKFYAEILEKINTSQWSYRKDFKERKRDKGRKKYVVRAQKVQDLCEDGFKKLDLTEAQRHQFVAELHFGEGRCKPWLEYVFREPWRFVLQVRPHMVDKEKVIDPDLETRMAEIEHYLERSDYKKRQWKILDGWYKCEWESTRKRPDINPLKNKPIYRLLDELKDE